MERGKKIGDLYKKTMQGGGTGKSDAAKSKDVFTPADIRAVTRKASPSADAAKPAAAVRPAVFPQIKTEKTQPASVSAAAAFPREETGGNPVPPLPEPKPSGFLKLTGNRETSVRKAAKFLMLIGKDEAAKVMQHFSAEEAEAVAREISGIRRIENAEAEKILTEFGFLREALKAPAGGVDSARRILVAAFGEEKGREILSRSVPPGTEKFFAFLDDFEPQQLQLIFRGEPPAVLAVITPYLEPETASKLFPLLGKGFRAELVRRMAKTEKISRDVLVRMDEALREKARKLSAPAREEEIDGKGVLAEILKYVDLSEEEKIIRNIEDENPVIAEEIKERLFTIDVLDYMEDSDLQKILRDMSDQEIALLLKGKSDIVRAKILMNVSERRRAFVTDEYRVMGAVPKKDVDASTRDFLNVLRRLEAAGEITFHREGDEWVK